MKETVMELVQRMKLIPHVEGGCFRELDEKNAVGDERAASGVIYYALLPGECSQFHVLDSDEYWLWHAGDPVEIWQLGRDGGLNVQKLGLGTGEEPCILIRGGTVFGARLCKGSQEGCVMSCLTVPQFSYEHYRILPREEAEALCPAAADFFDE